MGTRSKRSERCGRCRMHLERCVCPAIPRYELATRVVLVMHHREYPKPTATGPLALAALPNSEIRIHGERDSLLDLSDLATPERRILLLYPGDDVPVLSRELLERDHRPVTLVVPDGTWRQASRMGRRLPGLGHAEMVRLPEGPPTQWGIRRENHPQGLATFEAIARALGIIESPAVQAGLEELFRHMVRRTLEAGGRATASD
ncbi:DTW domain-containing protein [Geobacter hydrogenophilus]|uniref:tRNA-uridine aminocarboxypropyltransferase n=1 Tax=Geobacter hydrogenophilus TaxID=40983 RepID=A0A9W6G0E9_9BACT|nr:tRNA-uridine aminocarboxypropyltransferase [Geobacter hydrogenophilus]MBT0893950.1 DTW domain-containing protein [Geobacter hydrogenophilus]GLI38103.1 DTW domain-containing protein [Geobacter hydrogenophilus]